MAATMPHHIRAADKIVATSPARSLPWSRRVTPKVTQPLRDCLPRNRLELDIVTRTIRSRCWTLNALQSQIEIEPKKKKKRSAAASKQKRIAIVQKLHRFVMLSIVASPTNAIRLKVCMRVWRRWTCRVHLHGRFKRIELHHTITWNCVGYQIPRLL